ncbi:hypothetical protein P154DRAFT_421649, partial [Amniculicola lignicola CBS 123094]
ALQGYKEILRLKYILTLLIVNNLGILYKNQGKLVEVEAIYSKLALQGYKEALRLKHILILNIVNNLGILYKNQGKLVEVEAIYSYKEAISSKLLLLYLPVLNIIFYFSNLLLGIAYKDIVLIIYTYILVGYTAI